MVVRVSAKAGKQYDYDLVIIGCGVGGHGAALHAVESVCYFHLAKCWTIIIFSELLIINFPPFDAARSSAELCPDILRLRSDNFGIHIPAFQMLGYL